jgi:hypothetical protein
MGVHVSETAVEVQRLHAERECRVFCRYLVRHEPEPYVVQKYLDAHAALNVALRETPLDRLLMRLALRGPAWTRWADTYSRLVAPSSVLRSKLVLLVAILETKTPTERYFRPQSGRWLPVAYLSLVGYGFRFLFSALVAITLVGPLHLLLRVGHRSKARAPKPVVNGA